MRKQEALAALQSAHPDMKEVLTNKQFQEWVGKSKIRQQLFEDADKNYNYEAASELFDLWKDRQAVVEQTAKVEKVAQKQEVKKAATGSARSNPDSQSSRKIYRRRDIIELMNKDPKRYEALQPEIMKAYSEGRVR
jgi:recombination DNA repair RAD52 pathway protein